MTSWTVQHTDVSAERKIITGLITSDRVLRSLALVYRPRFLTVPYARQVAQWCLEYLERYDQAPGRHIQDLYEAHRRAGMDPDVAELIGQFLASISEDYEQEGNPEFLLDRAQQYFEERSLTLLKEDLEERLGQGNILAAREAVANFIAPESVVTLGHEPLREPWLVRAAFEREDELFSLRGDLGRLLGPFIREDAWGLVGGYKAGKSWLCYHIQDQALYKRLNVARFSFEMNRDKETRRFIQSISGMPIRPPREGRIWLPVWDCRSNQDGSCRLQARVNDVQLFQTENQRPPFSQAPGGYRPCSACRGGHNWRLETWAEEYVCDALTWREAWRRAEAVAQQLRGARFKFQYWPIRSAGMQEVRATLRVWEHLEGFVPDVVVVDSPDIMKRSKSGDERHSIVENRQDVVALAQQYHALVVFPLQAGSKAAVERKSKRQTDIGESVQVLGDVDGMIALDCSDEEREAGRARVKTTVQRDDKAVLSNEVAILQCIEIGQAVLDSAFWRGGK